MRILVVEDEARLAQTLAELLHRQGYTADISSDGLSGLDNAASDIYDLVVLDAMLPGMDGFTLLQRLRQEGHTVPVLMLTARSGVEDKVRGLDSGADYYLTKPFEPQELLACVRLLLRRTDGQPRQEDAVTCGDLRLEPGTFLLRCGQREVRLSRREYDLMELLIRSYPQIVTKEQLILKVWGYDSDAEDNNVEVYISFLRRKLEHLHSAVKIRTHRMVGYCWRWGHERYDPQASVEDRGHQYAVCDAGAGGGVHRGDAHCPQQSGAEQHPAAGEGPAGRGLRRPERPTLLRDGGLSQRHGAGHGQQLLSDQ